MAKSTLQSRAQQALKTIRSSTARTSTPFVSPIARAAPAVGAPAPAPAAAAPAQFVPDAQYLAEQAKRQFDTTTAVQGYQLQNTQDEGTRDESLRRLATARPDQINSSRVNYRKAGLFNSGQLTKALDDSEAAYVRNQADVRSQYDNPIAQRNLAIQRLNEGAPLDEAAGLAQSANRQIATDTTAAQANQLAVNPIASATLAAGYKVNSKTGAQYKTVKAPGGGVFHVYTDGRRVWSKS